MERRLGRGLGSLLAEPRAEEARQDIPLARIRPNRHQPRKTFEPRALEELAGSLKKHGVLQPVVVRPTADGFELIAGERRWRAARLAGIERLPAVVRDGVSDEQMLELALVENLQRENLDPIERARGYRSLIDTFELTQEETAQRVGLGRATVANHLRLLELPEKVQEGLARGLLDMGHARALLGLESERAQLRLLAEIARDQLSVREVERRVRAAGTKPSKAAMEKGRPVRPPWVVELEGRLREALGTKVLVNPRGERGSIEIEYYDRAGLEALLERLAPRPTL